MTRTFDRFVMVDWSANSRPKSGADSIWSASLCAATGAVACVNHRTRHELEVALCSMLANAPDQRTLLGFDFPLGYPAGFAQRVAGPGANWRDVWALLSEQIDDDPRNRNNRFEVAAALNRSIDAEPGPFWGCPPSRATASLRPTKPSGFVFDEFRTCERALRARGFRPFSNWQLLGVGAVGSQAMLGIPLVHRLRHHPEWAGRARVWPFEPESCGGGQPNELVFAEIWPSGFALDLGVHAVRDAAQVIGVCHRLAELDSVGSLARQLGSRFDPDAYELVTNEEGWILTEPHDG